MKVVLSSEFAGYPLKCHVLKHLQECGHEVIDVGQKSETEKVLYPQAAAAAARAIQNGEAEKGIVICGSGAGMSIVANKVPGIRAAVCHDPFSTERSRKSNNAQIMCMGERVIGVELAKYLVDIWLKCDFAGGGSAPKVARIDEIDESYRKR